MHFENIKIKDSNNDNYHLFNAHYASSISLSTSHIAPHLILSTTQQNQ